MRLPFVARGTGRPPRLPVHYKGASKALPRRYQGATKAPLELYASDLAVQPRIGGSAPFYQFTDRLGLPMIPSGLGFGTGAHAPNEIMLIEPAEGTGAVGLAEVEKAYVDFVYALAE